jgi:hypothetical protein
MPPNFDLAAAYPAVAGVLAAVEAKDWPAIRAAYLGSDWAGRSMLAGVIGDVAGIEHFLRTARAAQPADPVPATLLGAHLIAAGWAIRTSARASHVSATQFVTFREYLVRAEQLLIEVTAREPGDVTAWALRLNSARGLELGQAEARRRYDRAASNDPHNVAAQRRYLQQLCPKWGGTFEQVNAFARACLLAAPEGALNGVLVVDAHLERWLDYDDDRQRKLYFALPNVAQEVREAAERSVWHPGFTYHAGWVEAQNSFAAAFSLLGDARAAAYHFRAVGHLASEYPWDYLGDPAEEFQRYRAWALATGGA